MKTILQNILIGTSKGNNSLAHDKNHSVYIGTRKSKHY